MARCVEDLTTSAAEFLSKKMLRDYKKGVGADLKKKERISLKEIVDIKKNNTVATMKKKNKNIRLVENLRDKYYPVGSLGRDKVLDAVKKFNDRKKKKAIVVSNKTKNKLVRKMEDEGFKSIDKTILDLFKKR